jgi:hypothetical protein
MQTQRPTEAELAGRYERGRIEKFTGVTFEEFKVAPAVFEGVAALRRAAKPCRGDYNTRPFRLKTLRAGGDRHAI